jgi:hypothetical protein
MPRWQAAGARKRRRRCQHVRQRQSTRASALPPAHGALLTEKRRCRCVRVKSAPARALFTTRYAAAAVHVSEECCAKMPTAPTPDVPTRSPAQRQFIAFTPARRPATLPLASSSCLPPDFARLPSLYEYRYRLPFFI